MRRLGSDEISLQYTHRQAAKKMAPTQRLSSHLRSLEIRSHHIATTWWVLGGVVGLSAVVCVLGIWVVCCRYRRHKHVQKLKAQRGSKGKYFKLEDREWTFEQELQSSPKVNAAKVERDRSNSDTKQSRHKQPERNESSPDLEPQRSRSRSVSPVPNAPMLGAQRSRGRSFSPAPKLLSFGNKQHGIFLPPPSLSRDHSRSRSLPRFTEDSFEDHKPQFDRVRSASPASFVLSRNASMLQSRSRSRSPYAQR